MDECDHKPDVTSGDYLAGVKAGRWEGRREVMQAVQVALSGLAWEVKRGKHQKNALNILRLAWRRIDRGE